MGHRDRALLDQRRALVVAEAQAAQQLQRVLAELRRRQAGQAFGLAGELRRLELQPAVRAVRSVVLEQPGARGDSSSGSVTKVVRLDTGLEIRVPLFIKEGEKVKVSTESGEFAGRA